MHRLDGMVALVTGSSRGIGAAIARVFAAHGASIALHGRNQSRLSMMQAAIESEGGKAAPFVADVTCFADIDNMRIAVEETLGPIDILVVNAGSNAAPPGPIEEIEEHAWRATLDGNLTAAFLTVKSILPGMKGRGHGNIITISSAAARRPHPQSPIAYAAAKAGIQMFTQDLAAQAGPWGVRVNCLAPETILTERNLQRIPVEQRNAMSAANPLRRLGSPEDVANAALYLASDYSAWVTGIILDVAGGNVMV